MFDTVKKLWNENGFEIMFVFCLILICIFALFRIGKRGSWSKSFYYNADVNGNVINQDKLPKKDSKGEIECRRVLRSIFNRPFNKSRPNFLNNPVTGGRFNLELDCYDDSLRLAVEYNGAQHYKYIPYFHRNKEAFYNQKYRDELKRRMCRDNRVNLIDVPNTVGVNDIEGFLINKLRMIGYIK